METKRFQMQQTYHRPDFNQQSINHMAQQPRPDQARSGAHGAKEHQEENKNRLRVGEESSVIGNVSKVSNSFCVK